MKEFGIHRDEGARMARLRLIRAANQAGILGDIEPIADVP